MKKLIAALLVATSAVPASATVAHYIISGTFDDGGSISGSFDMDADHFYKMTNVDMTSTATLTFASYHYDGIGMSGGAHGITGYNEDQATFLQISIGNFDSFQHPGNFDIVPSMDYGFEHDYATNSYRYFTGGTITFDAGPTTGGPTRVPEPAMLGLFGLGAIGLGLSRRRKA